MDVRLPAVKSALVQVGEADTLLSFKFRPKSLILRKLIVSNSVATVIIRAKLMLTVRTGSSNL